MQVGLTFSVSSVGYLTLCRSHPERNKPVYVINTGVHVIIKHPCARNKTTCTPIFIMCTPMFITCTGGYCVHTNIYYACSKYW